MTIGKKSALFAATALSMVIAMPAFAQSSAGVADDAENADDIIVTGTLIRGIAPGGSQSIGVSQEKITEIGAANTSDLVSAIPQAGSFNQFVGVRGVSNFSLAVNRPILRYLGFTSSSTASTLLLVDGHRLPGMGILQSSADVDAIPAGAIERIEVVTDGGSSTYGSDAVGGVMNFITRKDFNGFEVKGNYGFGEDIQFVNAGVTAGKSWDGGSAYITYDFAHHDELFGLDRDWAQALNWPLTAAAGGTPVGSSVNCAPGNILFANTGVRVGLPSLTTGGVNRCDNTEFTTIYPRETKHSVMASLLIDNGGAWSFSLKGYYVHRRNVSDGGPFTADLSVPSTIPGTANPNPNYIPVAGQPGAPCALGPLSLLCQTFQVNFGPVLGNSVPQIGLMESYGFTPSVKVDIGKDWQINAMFNYGRGNASFKAQVFNPRTLPTAALTAAFNPANLGAPGNAAAITTALDQFQVGRAIHDLVNARIVADGPLATMPGGELRVAIGAEYMQEKYSGFTSRNISAADLAAAKDVKVKRDVWSVFGEINLPIIGEENRGGIYGLSLTASGRYDHYSDFGNTFNPKIGINFEPTDWLRFRGNWGKAFQAPGVSDLGQILIGESVNALPTNLRPFFDPATPVPAIGHNGFIMTIGGTKPGLEPQKATTWSLGFDIKPPASGFSAGLTYYNINFKGAITIAPINLPTFYKNFANNAVLYTAGDPAMAAFYRQLTANVPGGPDGAQAQGAILQAGGSFANIYAVLDGRTTNQSLVTTDGLDFYVRYTHPTSFGDLYADIAGNYILSLVQGGPTGVLSVNGIDPNHKFSMATTVGAHIGDLQAQLTWLTNDGFDVGPTAGNLQQSRVKGFNLFNLFFKYDVPGESTIAKDLSFTLHIDNVFNTDPPLLRGLSNSINGAGNGFTLGRVVKIGVSKKF